MEREEPLVRPPALNAEFDVNAPASPIQYPEALNPNPQPPPAAREGGEGGGSALNAAPHEHPEVLNPNPQPHI